MNFYLTVNHNNKSGGRKMAEKKTLKKIWHTRMTNPACAPFRIALLGDPEGMIR